jgi:mono/diheme cytochrome c family protein
LRASRHPDAGLADGQPVRHLGAAGCKPGASRDRVVAGCDVDADHFVGTLIPCINPLGASKGKTAVSRRLKLMMLAGMAVSLAATTVWTATATTDAAEGRKLALQWCAQCHLVADSQSRAPVDGVPSFVALANDPAMTDAGIRAFLASPHPPMPNIALSRQQTDEIVAYILSLRSQ